MRIIIKNNYDSVSYWTASYIKNKIQLKEAQDTFSSFIQNHTKKNSGHVSISFLENNLKDDNYKKATLIKVLEIISKK